MAASRTVRVERTDVVEGPRERHRARPAHAPVGGLEPHDAAAGGGQPDRAPGVGAERAVDEAGGHGRPGPARRPAGAVAGAPRSLDVAVMGVVPEGPDRQLGEVQPAERDGAGRLQAGDGGRVLVGPEVLGDRRAAGRRPGRPRRRGPCGRGALREAGRGSGPPSPRPRGSAPCGGRSRRRRGRRRGAEARASRSGRGRPPSTSTGEISRARILAARAASVSSATRGAPAARVPAREARRPGLEGRPEARRLLGEAEVGGRPLDRGGEIGAARPGGRGQLRSSTPGEAGRSEGRGHGRRGRCYHGDAARCPPRSRVGTPPGRPGGGQSQPCTRFSPPASRRPTAFTPVWLMRQAGRFLPEYRAIRERIGFLELCRTPDVAAEVTVLPVEKLGVDAAILFADILLLVEPLGVGLEFSRGEGPVIRRPVRSAADVERLVERDPAETVPFVFETVRRARAGAGGARAADRLRRGAVHRRVLPGGGRGLARLPRDEAAHVRRSRGLAAPCSPSSRGPRRAT